MLDQLEQEAQRRRQRQQERSAAERRWEATLDRLDDIQKAEPVSRELRDNAFRYPVNLHADGAFLGWEKRSHGCLESTCSRR